MPLFNKGSTRTLSNMEFSCIHETGGKKSLRKQPLSKASERLSEVISSKNTASH